MNKLYSELRGKVGKLQAADSSFFKINLYKTLLGILKYAIILTRGAGDSFPLIFQAQGSQIVPQSYKDFKAYQKKVRISFLVILVILAVVAYKMY
jgi:hypothetical protein